MNKTLPFPLTYKLTILFKNKKNPLKIGRYDL